MTRLVKLGDGAVGKTCLLMVYATNRQPPKYIPTVFDNYIVMVEAPDELIELSLWDTAGQEEYESLRQLSYQDADVVLVCFSLVSRTSFENVATKWLPEVQQCSPRANTVLCGTKCDLKEDPIVSAEFRKKGELVSQEEAQELGRRMKAYKYFECSAFTGKNVKAVFDAAIISVLFPSRGRKKKRCVIM